MKIKLQYWLLLAALYANLQAAFAQGTAFTYQGRLNANSAGVSGNVDMTFALFNLSAGGLQIGSTNTILAQPVTNGLFTVLLDFGSSSFGAGGAWLEIQVRTNGGTFAKLTPRQQVTPVPYAVFAENTAAASIAAAQLSTSNLPSSGQVLGYSGGGLAWLNAPNSSTVWGLTGNAGTVAGTDYLGTTDNQPLDIHAGGNVGINTATPGSELTIFQANGGGRGAELSLVNTGISPTTGVVGNEVAINFGTDNSSYNGDLGNAQIKARNMNADNRTDIIMSTYDGSVFAERMRIQAGGNVGIGTSTPRQALDVNGEFMVVEGVANEQVYIGGDGLGNDAQIGSLNSTVTDVVAWNATTNGYMNFRCASITIEGGSDLAEPFAMSQTQILPGSVVVIDKAQPGKLKLSTREYDRCVAGVVSGANGIHPGISMQQTGVTATGQNVALTGRVYVLADTSNGAIEAGDLLTTSAVPGHAMRASDPAKLPGAVLGKAMSPLAHGNGMVLILVSLQ